MDNKKRCAGELTEWENERLTKATCNHGFLSFGEIMMFLLSLFFFPFFALLFLHLHPFKILVQNHFCLCSSVFKLVLWNCHGQCVCAICLLFSWFSLGAVMVPFAPFAGDVTPAAGYQSTLMIISSLCVTRGSLLSSGDLYLWVTFSLFLRLFLGHHSPLIQRNDLHFMHLTCHRAVPCNRVWYHAAAQLPCFPPHSINQSLFI